MTGISKLMVKLSMKIYQNGIERKSVVTDHETIVQLTTAISTFTTSNFTEVLKYKIASFCN